MNKSVVIIGAAAMVAESANLPETAAGLREVKAPLDRLIHIAGRILAAHDSRNNGAVMGEATLCPYFAAGLREALRNVGEDA